MQLSLEFTPEAAERFAVFDRENPAVYGLFKRFALEALQAGHRHYSADAILHRIRWWTSVETRGDAYKINNNHAAWYARKLAADDKRFKEFFRNRASVADKVAA
jgi:hypothetical protein